RVIHDQDVYLWRGFTHALGNEREVFNFIERGNDHQGGVRLYGLGRSHGRWYSLISNKMGAAKQTLTTIVSSLKLLLPTWHRHADLWADALSTKHTLLPPRRRR